jgi:hypothetical protein
MKTPTDAELIKTLAKTLGGYGELSRCLSKTYGAPIGARAVWNWGSGRGISGRWRYRVALLAVKHLDDFDIDAFMVARAAA